MVSITGPNDPTMLIPSLWSYKFLLKDNAIFWQVSRINFFNKRLGNDVLISFSLYTRLRIKGLFGNNETASREANMYSAFSWSNGSIQLTLLTASKESLSKYSLCVNGFNSSKKYFPAEQRPEF